MNDVVIIGAGISGLAAARKLLQLKPDLNVIVVEAQERVGGRTWSVSLEGAMFDLGGHWVGGKHSSLLALAKEMEIDVEKQYDTGKQVLDVHGKVGTYTGLIPTCLPWYVLLEIHFLMTKIEKMRRKVATTSPLASSYAKEWDSTNAESWIQRRLWFEKTKELFRLVCRIVFGLEASEVSLLNLVLYSSSSGGMEYITNTKDGAQEFSIRGGMQQISIKIADTLQSKFPKNFQLFLGTKVEDIIFGNQGITLRCGKQIFKAKKAIFAAPPAIANHVNFSPPLPLERQLLMRRNLMGCICKVMVLYSTAFWRTDGFCGEVVCDCSRPLDIVLNVFDNSMTKKSGDLQPALACFVNGSAVAGIDGLSDSEIIKRVLTQLQRWFGDKALKPLRVEMKNWATDPFTRGCPTASWQAGALWNYGLALRQPVRGLHWAGTEMSTEFQGYVEGGIRSGERVAVEVIDELEGRGGEATAAAKRNPNQQQEQGVGRLAVLVVLVAIVFYLLFLGGSKTMKMK